MVKIVYWSLLPKIGNFLAKGSTRCVNLGVGIICGAAQAVSDLNSFQEILADFYFE